jgi:L-arabinose isomerase
MLRPEIFVKFVKQQIFDRWILVAYKIVNWNIRELVEGVQIKDDEKLYEVMNEYVRAYIEHDKMPPEPIRAAVLNVADDYIAGRQITLRTGDYISIQNFIHQRG